MPTLPTEIKPAMQGAVPSILATCAADGVPNVTVVSQVHWVDEERVALSFQFFSKTIRNVRENPQAVLVLNDIAGNRRWVLRVRYERSETSGPLFDAMDMQIEAIASMVGMKGIFKLRAADVFRVVSVARTSGERIPRSQIPPTPG